MPRPKWLLLLLLAPLTVLALACGGESEEEELARAADNVLLTYFDVLTGKKEAQAMVDLYAPECNAEQYLGDIEELLSLVAVFAPEIKNINIEEVDVGEVTVEKRGDEFLISPTDPEAIRVKVDGKFLRAEEYFTQLSGEATSDPGASMTTSLASIPGETALALKRIDGKLYVSTCEELQEFS